jgi:O-antigen/teichoic acid export membrane protein
LVVADFGPNSLAVGAVSVNIATGIGAWLARSDRQLLMPGFSEWRVIVNFGGQNTAAGIVTTISMSINDLVLGKVLGFTPVAMLSRAQGLMNLFHRDVMTAIRGVAFPAFAKAHREGESIEARYIASVTAVTVIAWPFYGFTAIYALELLRLLFGPQWDEAAPLVPLFSLAGSFVVTSSLILNLIIAVGRIDLATKAELLFQPLRAVLIVGAAIIFESLFACAVAFLISFIIHPPILYIVKGYCIPSDYRSLLENLWLSSKVALFSLVLPTCFSIYGGMGRDEPVSIFILLSAAVLCCISWVSGLFIFKHPVIEDPLFRRITAKLLLLLKKVSP